MLNWILLIEKIKKSKKIVDVYWNLLKKAIKLTMRNSNGPQKKKNDSTLTLDDLVNGEI